MRIAATGLVASFSLMIARAGLERQTRSRVRRLVEIRRAYGDARSRYLLAIRIKDHAFERLVAPTPDAKPERSLQLDRFLQQVAGTSAVEDELAELWTTFRAERLTLYRDLGALPCADWKTFYADLTARPKAVQCQ